MLNHLTRAKVEHLAFLAATAACVAVYMLDAWSVSHRVENLILIFPFGAAAIVLCIVIAIGLLSSAEEDDTPAAQDAAEAKERPLWNRLMPFAVMAVIAAYTFLLEIVGFDVATFGLVAISLFVQGDRKIVRVLLFSAAFTYVVVWGCKALLTVPIPTLLG